MRYTYTMTSTLHSLDDAVHHVRVALQRPAYARRMLRGLAFDGGMASLRVLRAVERSSEAPSIRQIATALGVEHSTASRLVDGLVRSGLVEKSPSATDQRQTLLRLTQEGGSLLDEATARRQQLMAEATQGWDDADVRTLAQLLQRLAEEIDAILTRPQ